MKTGSRLGRPGQVRPSGRSARAGGRTAWRRRWSSGRKDRRFGGLPRSRSVPPSPLGKMAPCSRHNRACLNRSIRLPRVVLEAGLEMGTGRSWREPRGWILHGG